ncbi:transposase zinc-binding domain-containing protein [Candidatus Woesearchaeota archaeon]|nr:transposase zinc-binding domain-containing protein [Candidatus Woesearchaeota archaeon]
MRSVRQILKENWPQYLKRHAATYHQKREIQKMVDCSKNSCNSRICSSCGKRYADTWSQNLKDNLHPAPCRHVVLTAPSLLRPILRDWNNLNILLQSSRDFFRICSQINS